jgi:lipoyl(octanoyl) transferase
MIWFLFRAGAGDPAWNMAVDETLLEFSSQLAAPILRFYSWTEPAASFGYFQKFSEVENLTPLRPLVRRPTAGGIVPHDRDWTYSLVFPPGNAWHELSACESYRRVHEWIRDAFEKVNVRTEVAPLSRRVLPGQCFEGHEQFDLLWHGKKIAGAAQRRNKLGLLIQGSIQPPRDADKTDWQNSFCDVAQAQWTVEWQPFEFENLIAARANELAEMKYSRESFLKKR